MRRFSGAQQLHERHRHRAHREGQDPSGARLPDVRRQTLSPSNFINSNTDLLSTFYQHGHYQLAPPAPPPQRTGEGRVFIAAFRRSVSTAAMTVGTGWKHRQRLHFDLRRSYQAGSSHYHTHTHDSAGLLRTVSGVRMAPPPRRRRRSIRTDRAASVSPNKPI